jgi:hypothetical protein
MRLSSVATTTASIPRASGGASVDVLDHRTTGDLCEWFSRESSRGVAGGNDGDRGDVCCSFEGITERDRVHGES